MSTPGRVSCRGRHALGSAAEPREGPCPGGCSLGAALGFWDPLVPQWSSSLNWVLFQGGCVHACVRMRSRERDHSSFFILITFS